MREVKVVSPVFLEKNKRVEMEKALFGLFLGIVMLLVLFFTATAKASTAVTEAVIDGNEIACTAKYITTKSHITTTHATDLNHYKGTVWDWIAVWLREDYEKYMWKKASVDCDVDLTAMGISGIKMQLTWK